MELLMGQSSAAKGMMKCCFCDVVMCEMTLKILDFMVSQTRAGAHKLVMLN